MVEGEAPESTINLRTRDIHTHFHVAAYAALNVRMSGSALIPGLPVPTADAGAMDAVYSVS